MEDVYDNYDNSANGIAVNIDIDNPLNTKLQDSEDENNGGQLDVEIDVDINLKKPISDIDLILGEQNNYESDAEEEGDNLNAQVIGNGDLDVDINLDVAASVGVDLNNNGNLGIEFPSVGLHPVNMTSSIDGELPFVESKHTFKINKDISKIPSREPDIHIRIDMDEVNKIANFVVDVPDKWSKKLINKWDDPKYRDQIQNKFTNGIDLDINEREKERLDVEINMFIGKENLEDSTVYALITPINVADTKRFDFQFQMPKFDFPKFSFKTKSADVELDTDSFQGNINGNLPEMEVDPDDSTKRRDFRFQFPKIEFPSFSLKGKPKTDDDINIEIDNSDPSVEIDVESPTKRRDFRFQFPKIEFPSLNLKTKSNVDGDLDIEANKENIDADVNVESPTKQWDFRFKLPKVDFSLFGNLQKSGDANADVEIDPYADEIHPEVDVALKSEVEIESPTNRFDFRFQFPKIEFSSFRGKARTILDGNLETDVTIPEDELNADGATKRSDFRFQLPTIEMPILIYKPKSHNAIADIDLTNNESYINADLELEVPSVNANSDSFFKKPNFQFQLPTIDFTLFGGKAKSNNVDVNGDIDVDIDGNVIDGELDADSPSKRYDFRFNFPKIEFPSLKFNAKPKVDGDLEIDVNKDDLDAEADVNVESPTKQWDFKFKLPKVDFSLFGNLQKSGNANADVEIDAYADEIHPEVDVALKSEIEIDSPPKRRDFRYQFPKIEFPSFVIKGKGNVESDINTDADVDVNSPESDVNNPTKRYNFQFQMPKINFPSFYSKEKSNADINADIYDTSHGDDLQTDDPVKRHDFRFQLPKIPLPTFNFTQKIDTTKIFGLDLHEDTRRYDFSFSFPDTKFVTFDGKVQFRDDSTEHDDDYNEFSITFDEGDSNRNNENVFKVILKNGVLKCSECHNGEWQKETNDTLVCVSPKKNWLVVFLPIQVDSELVIVFNEEVILKYGLQGSINTLQSFDLEGSVKLNAANLFSE